MDAITASVPAIVSITGAIERLTGPDNIGDLNGRRIVHKIDLHADGNTTTQLHLSVWHNKEAKRYQAALSVVAVIDRGGYNVTVSTPTDRNRARRLPPKDVSRYSATSLMAFRSETALMLRHDPSWLDLDLSPWAPQD